MEFVIRARLAGRRPASLAPTRQGLRPCRISVQGHARPKAWHALRLKYAKGEALGL